MKQLPLLKEVMLFMFPLFVEEMWRMGDLRKWRRWAALAAPVAVSALLAAWHNYARFGEATEFGYSYLRVRQQLDIPPRNASHHTSSLGSMSPSSRPAARSAWRV